MFKHGKVFLLKKKIVYVLRTSLRRALLPLRAGESVDKLCECSITIQQLLVGAALRDLSFNQHQDQISLG